MDSEGIRMIIQRVLSEGPFSMRQLADESSLSYDALRSWAADRRTPQPDNLKRLADAVEKRGARLHELAEQLRRAAEAA